MSAQRPPVTAPSTSPTPSPPARHADPLHPTDLELARLRAVAVTTPGHADRRIRGDATTQPDLYAAEFVRRLLTQNYQTSREQHLQWVQSEAAQTREPLVVGLVPHDLRDRLAVYSVTQTTSGPPPIPSPQEWRQLSALEAYTTVRIDRVEEPMAWSNAVAAGRITDLGITGRQVAATVTQHTVKDGRTATSSSSVALTLNLQGPPTRATWGFVTAVTYTSVPVTAS
ncbi:hypothetical protein [Terrabacter sp. MAHUQ-38]|uniref:hypothetical protein n=1 Tax=unclassified Terrabacter TaxID=2630222 RepID=UPI00165E9606|nr:hypothetical protein [Terrabacter sp. MAHUQ-38]MBC9822857.1 hypothetical protein [Terrabacter sp. MAHUQ-38]